jgi:hypothetical protein
MTPEGFYVADVGKIIFIVVLALAAISPFMSSGQAPVARAAGAQSGF